MATEYCNFTEKDLDAWVQTTLRQFQDDPASIPPGGEAFIRDRGGKNSVPGLTLRIRLRRAGGHYTTTNPHLGFYVVRRIEGRKVTRLIGDRGLYTVEMARNKSTEEQRELELGIDRKEDRRKADATAKARGLTYREALEAFLDQADVAPRTKLKYRLSLTTTFKALADSPLANFTEAGVRTLHKARSLESPSRADQDFRVLRLLWNWVRETHQAPGGEPLLGPNPVGAALNKRRAAGSTKSRWNMVARRQTIIPEDRLGDWFRALYALREAPEAQGIRVRSCDLLEALILTGLRFGELATLTWDRVDLSQGTLTIPGPLSKNRRPLVRTLTKRLREILEARRTEREAMHKEGVDPDPLVFPGQRFGTPITDPPRGLLDAIEERTGLRIVPHDLRRVFASAALRAGVPQEVLKRLLNHETGVQEVTSGYQILDRGFLLKQSQRVETEIRGGAGLLPQGGMNDEVMALLARMPEDEKRRLIFKLSAERVAGESRGVAHG